jgi:hypothetical protein
VWAAATGMLRSHGLPLRVRPLRRLPALWSLPGHIPAHEAKRAADGTRPRSVSRECPPRSDGVLVAAP